MNSTLAPSEKHLEDWIVANFEEFGDPVDVDVENGHLVHVEGIAPYFFELVEKQYPLPSGRPDLICYRCGTVSAVELKKGAITYDVIGQCLRYIYDLREIFGWVFARYTDFTDETNPYNYSNIGCIEPSEFPNSEITGMVVGSSFIDSNIPLVCAASNIKVVTYEYNGHGYTFTHHGINRKASITYRNQINTKVGFYMLAAMHWRAIEQAGGING